MFSKLLPHGSEGPRLGFEPRCVGWRAIAADMAAQAASVVPEHCNCTGGRYGNADRQLRSRVPAEEMFAIRTTVDDHRSSTQSLPSALPGLRVERRPKQTIRTTVQLRSSRNVGDFLGSAESSAVPKFADKEQRCQRVLDRGGWREALRNDTDATNGTLLEETRQEEIIATDSTSEFHSLGFSDSASLGEDSDRSGASSVDFASAESSDSDSEESLAATGSGRVIAKLRGRLRDPGSYRTAAEVLGSLLLAAPVHSTMPGGWVVMAATPGLCLGPPMGTFQEEKFADLIFPGFDGDAFVWKVTCLQIAEFAMSMFLGHNKQNPTPCVLYNLGASWGPAIARGQLWRLITPVMLHANLTHLLFNIFFQLRIGFGMEKQFGRRKMMLIYLTCGVLGNLISAITDPLKLAVGASTAGFGLIGVWFAEILLSWDVLGPARSRTILWIVFTLISVTTMSTMTPNMDLFGHLGGALSGFLMSILISDMREIDRPAWYPYARAAAAAGMALLVGGGFGRLYFSIPHDPIPNCASFF